MRATRVIIAIAAALPLLTGCLVEQRYIAPEEGTPGVWGLAIDETTPAFFESEDATVYLIEERIEIPFRQPTDDDLALLETQAAEIDMANVPYPELPWLQRGDYQIQVDWTLSNLSAEDATTATVTVNGINQFHEYNPGIEVVDDDLVIDFSGWERTYRLGPGERLSGIIREEELDEVAVDLATVVNGAPNANQIVYFENQSFNDRRSQMYIPDVIPALTGVRMGLRALSNTPVVLEVSVRVRDMRGVLVQGEDEPWMAPQPALFGPADAAAATMMMMPAP